MILASLTAILTVIGLVQAAGGAALSSRFAAEHASDVPPPAGQAAISVLKPLHGDEPLLEPALESLCAQDYKAFQIVFGVADPADPALRVVRRLRNAFPDCDIAVVADPARHGANGKVSNLINMLPAAKYDTLVIADSDVHAQADYLARLMQALEQPGTGLVTTLYTGLPAGKGIVPQLGATQITYTFLPGALLARFMGRQDCLGATMALRRTTLARIGGFQALADHLADDQVLGRRVAGLGLAVRLAGAVVATTVPETRWRDLWRHELRWARTIRALEPGPYAASILQYPLFWALLTVPLGGGAIWSIGTFLLAWAVRALTATWIDRTLEPFLTPKRPFGRPALPGWRGGAELRPHDLQLADGADLSEAARGVAFPCPVWLLPLRDIISVGVMLASYAGRRVEWRGHHQIADPGRVPPGPNPPKGLRPR